MILFKFVTFSSIDEIIDVRRLKFVASQSLFNNPINVYQLC